MAFPFPPPLPWHPSLSWNTHWQHAYLNFGFTLTKKPHLSAFKTGFPSLESPWQPSPLPAPGWIRLSWMLVTRSTRSIASRDSPCEKQPCHRVCCAFPRQSLLDASFSTFVIAFSTVCHTSASTVSGWSKHPWCSPLAQPAPSPGYSQIPSYLCLNWCARFMSLARNTLFFHTVLILWISRLSSSVIPGFFSLLIANWVWVISTFHQLIWSFWKTQIWCPGDMKLDSVIKVAGFCICDFIAPLAYVPVDDFSRVWSHLQLSQSQTSSWFHGTLHCPRIFCTFLSAACLACFQCCCLCGCSPTWASKWSRLHTSLRCTRFEAIFIYPSI